MFSFCLGLGSTGLGSTVCRTLTARRRTLFPDVNTTRSSSRVLRASCTRGEARRNVRLHTCGFARRAPVHRRACACACAWHGFTQQNAHRWYADVTFTRRTGCRLGGVFGSAEPLTRFEPWVVSDQTAVYVFAVSPAVVRLWGAIAHEYREVYTERQMEEQPKRGRGRPPKKSGTKAQQKKQQQQGEAAEVMDVEQQQTGDGAARRRAAATSAPPAGGGGSSSTAGGGTEQPKKRGRPRLSQPPSNERCIYVLLYSSTRKALQLF